MSTYGHDEHPERMRRPHGSYDPWEQMTLDYADLIGARNAVGHLVQLLTDSADPPSEYRRQVVQHAVTAGVYDTREEFDTFEAAVEWLTDLRERLNDHLPEPVAGVQGVLPPDQQVERMRELQATAAQMTEEEAAEAQDHAAREFTRYTLHHRRPRAQQQGDTDPSTQALQGRRATAAGQLWLAVTDRLSTGDT